MQIGVGRDVMLVKVEDMEPTAATHNQPALSIQEGECQQLNNCLVSDDKKKNLKKNLCICKDLVCRDFQDKP